jgi:DHA1 family multidrug resistance protein-like MFS transporter
VAVRTEAPSEAVPGAHAGQPGWRRDFAVLTFAQSCAIVGFSLALPFLPLYVQTLGVTDPAEAAVWAGAMSSAGGLTMAFMAPVWGSLADRYGRKPMVTRSMFGASLFVAAMALVEDVRHLFGLRAAQGLFSGTVPASRLLAASIVPSNRLGQTMGMMATAQFVGSSFAPLVGGLVAESFGFRTTFMLTGVLLGVAGLVVLMFVRERFVRPAGAGRRGGRLADVKLLFGAPEIGAIVAVMLAVQLGQMGLGPVMPLFVQSMVGPGEPVASTVGLIVGSSAIASAVAASVGGRLGDRVGHQRVLVVATLATGLLYLPQALAQSPGQLLVVRAITGTFLGAVVPVGMARVALLTPPASRGWVFGLTTTATTLGNAAGPLLCATIAANLGFRAAFVFSSAVVTAAGLWAVLSGRRRAGG